MHEIDLSVVDWDDTGEGKFQNLDMWFKCHYVGVSSGPDADCDPDLYSYTIIKIDQKCFPRDWKSRSFMRRIKIFYLSPHNRI